MQFPPDRPDVHALQDHAFDDMDDKSPSCTQWPCANALVAGTVALMTAWADPCDGGSCSAPKQRQLIARKIASNLYYLMQHPQVNPPLRRVMSNAQHRWVQVAARQENQNQADAWVASTQPDGTRH
jgi:hypothetical protein